MSSNMALNRFLHELLDKNELSAPTEIITDNVRIHGNLEMMTLVTSIRQNNYLIGKSHDHREKLQGCRWTNLTNGDRFESASDISTKAAQETFTYP